MFVGLYVEMIEVLPAYFSPANCSVDTRSLRKEQHKIK